MSSCDAYSDVWDPFFDLFFRYWSDCPYPVFLVSNELVYEHPRVHTITVGPDVDWSTTFLQALEAVDFDYVLVMMEDYFICEAPETERIEEFLRYMTELRVACVRLFPVPPPDGRTMALGLAEVMKGSLHRVSLQAALWDAAFLRGVVRRGESPWQFESEGTKRADQFPAAVLSVSDIDRSPLRYLCTAVVRGKWVRPAIALLEKEAIKIDLRRPVESQFAELSRRLRYRLEELAWHLVLKRRSSGSRVRDALLSYVRLRLPKPFTTFIRGTLQWRAEARWRVGGRTGLPPMTAKRRILREYAKTKSYSSFVETGTYKGDTLRVMLRHFDELYSVELDTSLFQAASARFRKKPQVRLYHGDSGDILPRMLAEASKPCLVWLDGHWSGGETARGNQVTPVIKELDAIFKDRDFLHGVLIDDARLFTGQEGYPSLHEITDLVREHEERYQIEVAMDIIRIMPSAGLADTDPPAE